VTVPLPSREYVAWDPDGSVHLPANHIGHLHDHTANYLADGDVDALAALVVAVAELCGIDCDEREVDEMLRARTTESLRATVVAGQLQRAAAGFDALDPSGYVRGVRAGLLYAVGQLEGRTYGDVAADAARDGAAARLATDLQQMLGVVQEALLEADEQRRTG
jgi:hypothetical protein